MNLASLRRAVTNPTGRGGRLKNLGRVFIVILVLGSGSLARADIRLSNGFSSGMVLQRDVPARIAGYADPGEAVVVRVGDRVVGETVGEGQGKMWSVTLPVFKAGPVEDITVKGKTAVTLTDLIAGDVWVCSGQSNMEMSLAKGPWCSYGGVLNEAEEVAAADHPQIRLLTSPGKEGWTACTPESVQSFSAAGYFFGRELHGALDVPIGLVQAAVGGTPAEYWVPRNAREAWTGFSAELESARKVLSELKPVFDADRAAWAEWRKTSLQAQESGQPVTEAPTPKLTDEESALVRAAIHVDTTGQGYASRILPLTVMPVRGVIWYQGEANTARAAQYAELMRQLITGWRADWDQPDLPFVIMQLANFGGGDGMWPALRAAQEEVVNTLPGTALAISIDLGEEKDIHPKNKQDVGKRLALVAMEQVYGMDVVAHGPTLEAAEFTDGKVRLTFDPGGGDQHLVFRSESGSGFELAGADGEFLPASAVEAVGNTLVLASPQVPQPQAVRYAWEDNPSATLFNPQGLPAAPFQMSAVTKGDE